MNQKSIISLTTLIVLAVLLLLGLPFTTDRIIENCMGKTVMETATPMPDYESYEQ